MRHHRRAGLALATCLLALATAAQGAQPAYRLGPQDKLRIRVYDWRSNSGEAHEWPALSGEFAIGSSGDLSLPLIGEVDAGQKTTAEVAATITDLLQAKIGLAQRPDASVEVIRYRPFYILGEVDKPGEYDYRPEMTILQAFSTAGGLPRLSDLGMSSFERDALVSRGDLRALDAERVGLLARQARLDAEIKGADAIAFPAELTNRTDDLVISRAIREERLLFDSHHSSDLADRTALVRQKDLITDELNTFKSKDQSLAHQLDVTGRELAQVSGLVAKGFAVMPRQLDVERNTAQLESSRLDVALAMVRAQQDLARVASDLDQIVNKRRSTALTESVDVRVKLADLAERVETTQKLIAQAEGRAPVAALDAMQPRQPVYTLTRVVDGNAETRIVQEKDLLQPGDILRVGIDSPTTRSSSARPQTIDAAAMAPSGAGGSSTSAN